MDFGLAKLQAFAAGSQSSAPAFSAVATIANLASPITLAGTILGTVQYMSPEQIQGKDADARSDIFAFGAMMYEMLTGKRAFEGKSQLSVASSVLEKDPEPISSIQPLTPPALANIIKVCLAKDPDERFQSAHDLKLQLQWITAGGSQAGASAVVVSQRKNRRKLLAAATVVGCLIALAAVLLAAMYANRLNSALQLVRAQITQPEDFDFAPVLFGPPVISPDGQQMAFVASKNNKFIIVIQRLSTGKGEPLAGTEEGNFPFWSPDAQYLGFFANAKLKKIKIGGGPVQALCDAPEGRGGAWNEQGVILFAPRIAGPLQRVSDGGGTPENATPARPGDTQFTNRNPYFLPDGKHFLFVQRSANDALGSVFAGSLDGGQPKPILPVGSNVAYSNGHLFYVKDGTLMAQAFDAAKLRFKGKPVPVAESVEYYDPRNLGYFSVSQNVLLYRRASIQNRELVWLDATGKELEHWGESAPYIGGNFSPRSRTAVLFRANADAHGNSLWLADVDRKTVTRLTPDSEMDQRGIGSADGKSVLRTATSGYGSVLTMRSLVSSGKEEQLATPDGYVFVDSQSIDGRYVFFSVQDAKTSFDIYVMDMAGDRKLTPVLNSPYSERDPRLSPDNKWLAFSSDENGGAQFYVTPFPGGGSKWQVSSGVDAVPITQSTSVLDWSPDGKTLYYLGGEKIYAVEVRTAGSKPEFSAPKELMSLPATVDLISILPDGKRILATRPVGQSTAPPLGLVLNWQHLLQ